MQENWGKDDITLVHDKETKDGITQLNGEIYTVFTKEEDVQKEQDDIYCAVLCIGRILKG